MAMELSELYRALEIAHYGERLRDTVTLLGLSRNTSFQDLILDFKVLAAHRARLVVVAPDPAFELSRTVALMNTHGGRFHTVETQEPRDSRSDALRVDIVSAHAHGGASHRRFSAWSARAIRMPRTVMVGRPCMERV